MFRQCISYFLVPILLYNIEGKPREIKCPDYCECDIYETFRRAVCRNKKLYSIEIDMPAEAEILDISYNQISDLGNNIFLEIGLTNLKLLNLSHNKVGYIHLNGFEGLAGLRTLDISFNMLRYFSQQWFVSLASLQEFYLRGNNLASINDEPPLSFGKLKVLDISFCAIESLHPGVFKNIPSLSYLDVSENYLTHLKPEVIKGLSQLTTIRVKGNPSKCRDLRQLKTYVTTNGISYDDPCQGMGKKNRNKKFERIISLVSQTPDKNGWLYDPQKDAKTEIRVLEVCNDGRNRTLGQSENQLEAFIMEVITLSPLLFITFTLVFGITVDWDRSTSLFILTELLPPTSVGRKRDQKREIAASAVEKLLKFQHQEIPLRDILTIKPSPQPFLLGVGTKEGTVTEYFVEFDNHVLSVGKTIVEGFDSLLKYPFVFDIQFYPALDNFFNFCLMKWPRKISD